MNTKYEWSNRYQIVNGFKLPLFFPTEASSFALAYKAKSDDKFIVTYPKSGTTWTQQMLFLILNNGVPQKDDSELFDKIPFLDYDGSQAVETLKKPEVIKAHLPYHLQPYNDNAKYLLGMK